MAHRLAAARLVDKGVPYAEVAERVGGSTTTVTRVAHWLRHGEGGYRARARPPRAEAHVTRRGLLRLALPSKGRLAEPATRLLHRRRHPVRDRRAARCTRTRTTSISTSCSRAPTTSRCGRRPATSTSASPARTRSSRPAPTSSALLELGFGRCRLALAVPEGAAIASLADLDGGRIATSYPRTRRGAPRARRRRGERRHARRLGRAGTAAARRRCDRRPRLERRHAAPERPRRARDAARVAGRADRAARPLAAAARADRRAAAR